MRHWQLFWNLMTVLFIGWVFFVFGFEAYRYFHP